MHKRTCWGGRSVLKIAICDDEPIFLDKLNGLIKEALAQYDISDYCIDTFSSGNDLICKERFVQYQVIFLDISMPEMSGMDLAAKIRERDSDVLLVFVTAFMNFAMEGYKMEAIRFLHKDMLDDALPECIKAIINKLSLDNQTIEYNFLEEKKKLSIDRIWYVESFSHKLIFYVLEGEMKQYTLCDKLDNIEEKLLPLGFIRIHKSFLVNFKHINKITNYNAYLKNGTSLPIPREKFKKVKERYYEIKGDLI